MERTKLRDWFTGRKPWPLLAAGLAGIFLLFLSSLIPAAEAEQPETAEDPAAAIEARLETLVSQLDGAGKAEVMVSLADNGSTRYLSESSDTEEWSDGTLRRKEQAEKYVTSGGSAVPVAELAPSVEGAAVICEGGGDPRVQSDIYALLYALYGLSSTRVRVEQMNR